MKTRLLPADSPEAFQEALKVLKQGGLVAFPTDTVYGLGALAFDGQAVARIYRAKGRTREKAIPVLLPAVDQLEAVARDLPEAARRLARRFWPGPLTLVVPKRPELPPEVSATDTVGVRVPDHREALHLLRLAGPMAVTSANRSGGASACTAEEVLAALEGRIDLILDGGRTPGGIPSTVVDCTSPGLKVLREGPLSRAALEAALAGED